MKFQEWALEVRHLPVESLRRCLPLGIRAPYEEMGVFELVLAMFLGSPKGRPTSATIAGRLTTALERLGS
jgi:hypothetical protein